MEKRRFTTILLPQEEGGYRVLFPYHPDCFVWGDTPEEALDRAKDAIITHLEGLAEAELDLMLDYTHAPHVAISEVEIEVPKRLLDISKQEQPLPLASKNARAG